MKVLFIEAQSKGLELNKNINSFINELPDEISVFYSIQYKKPADIFLKKAEKAGKKIKKFSQILGCKIPKTDKTTILIGSGKFHALQIAMQNKTPIYIVGKKISKLDEKETEKFKKKRKSAIKKFLSSEDIGIIVSTKPGQNNLNRALEIKEKLKLKQKKPYIFITNTLSLNELENFSMDIWINTSCPGLKLDSSEIVDFREINSYL